MIFLYAAVKAAKFVAQAHINGSVKIVVGGVGFKAVAFGDSEELTYVRGERDRLTASGLKGDAIFYRKVMLACGGTVWRHVAMEYPASARHNFDTVIERVSRAFERIADDSCGASVFTHPQPVANTPEPEKKPADEKPAEKPAPPN